MNETYVEHMVARKKSLAATALKVVLYALAVILFVLGLGSIIFFIAALVVLAVAYFVMPYTDLEFEYLYLDREITIDKVIAKQRRKRACVVDLNKMEFIAPVTSHELDSYKNRKLKTLDYGSKLPDAKPYVIVYHAQDGDQLVIFEPNEEMLKAVKNLYPRKVLDY